MTIKFSINANRGSVTHKEVYFTESEALDAYNQLLKLGYSLTLYKVKDRSYTIYKSNLVSFNTEVKGRYKPEIKPTKSKVKRPELDPNRTRISRTQWVLY
jgi:hypothetical protein